MLMATTPGEDRVTTAHRAKRSCPKVGRKLSGGVIS